MAETKEKGRIFCTVCNKRHKPGPHAHHCIFDHRVRQLIMERFVPEERHATFPKHPRVCCKHFKDGHGDGGHRLTWKDLVENGLLLSATPTSRTSSSKRAAVAAAAEEQERKRRRSEEAQQRREERAREQQEERERAARQVALTRSARASAESTPPCPPPSTTTPSSSSTSSSSSSSSTSSSSSSSSSTHTNEPATSPSREWPEWRCETTSGLGDCVARLPSLFLPPSTPSAEQLAVLCHVFDNALDALMLTDSGIDLSVAACNDAFALRDNLLDTRLQSSLF